MRQRVETLQWSVAEELLRVGTTVIIEWDTWSRRERDELRHQARFMSAPVELCYLHAPADELWRRLRARGAGQPPIERAHFDEWSSNFDEPDAEEPELADPPVGG